MSNASNYVPTTWQTGDRITADRLNKIEQGLSELSENGQAVNGIPSGGTTGQILAKVSGTDYDATWINNNPVTIDSTLLTSNSAADAKVVGDVAEAVVGTNLLRGVGETSGSYINASGVVTANANSTYTDLVPVTGGETYKLLLATDGNSTSIRIHAYTNNAWQSQINNWTVATGLNSLEFTIPAEANGIRISYADRARHTVVGLVVHNEYDGFASDGQARTSLMTTDALVDGIASPVDYTVTEGGYLRLSTGVVASSASWNYTSYIDISQYDKIVFSCPVASGSTTLSAVAAIAFYSYAADSSFVESVSLVSGSANGYELRTVDIPTGARYARASIWATVSGTYFFRPVSNIVARTTDVKQLALSAFGTGIASGSIASFTDGADGAPVKSLVVNVDPVQSGSGDPSPDNVRPITGWTATNVTRCGKNLLPPYSESAQTKVGITLTNNDGVYTLSGTSSLRASFDIPINLPPNSYHFAAFNAEANNSVGVYLMSGTPSAYSVDRNIPFNAVNKTDSFTTEKTVTVVRITVAANQTLDNFTLAPMIMLEGSTATDYEPYQGDTYSIDWTSEAGTVYGGTLDATTGELTVTHASELLSNKSWTYFTNYAYPFFRTELPSASGASASGVVSDYKVISGNYSKLSTNHTACFYSISGSVSNYHYFCIRDDTYTDTATFRSAVTDVQVVYELATPITYQLAPTEITTLLGENHIWADCGDVNITYRADTALYIKRLTGSTETDMVADSNIPNNAYFMIGNTLYLSTAAIAAGATIVPGTNCTLTNLAAALNALNT